MSKESVSVVVNDALQRINMNLSKLIEPVNNKAIETAFDEPIKIAFESIKKAVNNDPGLSPEEKKKLIIEGKKQLFWKLSVKCHPDKLQTGKDKFVTTFRTFSNYNDFLHIPQEIVNKYNRDNENLMDLAVDLGSMTDSIEIILKRMGKLLDLSRLLQENIMRYPSLFRYLIFGSLLAIATVISIAFIITGCTMLGLSIRFANLERLILKIITQNQYDLTLNQQVTRKQMAELAREELCGSMGIDASEASDEDAISIYLDEIIAEIRKKDTNADVSRQQLEQELIDELKGTFSIITHLNFIFNSFVHELTKLFADKRWWKNIPSVVLRMIQAVLMLPALLLGAVRMSTLYALDGAFMVALAGIVLGFSALLFVLNIPLYIYDALCAIKRGAGSDQASLSCAGTPLYENKLKGVENLNSPVVGTNLSVISDRENDENSLRSTALQSIGKKDSARSAVNFSDFNKGFWGANNKGQQPIETTYEEQSSVVPK